MKYLLAIAVAIVAVAWGSLAHATHGVQQFQFQRQQQCGQQAIVLRNVGHHNGVQAIVVPQSFGFFQAQRQPQIRLQINGNRGFSRSRFRQGFRQGLGDNRVRFQLRIRR